MAEYFFLACAWPLTGWILLEGAQELGHGGWARHDDAALSDMSQS
jgi:hypothetical protein